jgi:hypothetical protein
MKLMKRKKSNNSLKTLITLKTISVRSLVLLIKSLRLFAPFSNLSRKASQLNILLSSSITQFRLDEIIKPLRLCIVKDLRIMFVLSLCAAALGLTLLTNSIRKSLGLMLNCTNYALNSVRI